MSGTSAPRHRADPDPVRAAKAAVRSYQRTIATRRRDRASRGQYTDAEEPAT